MKEENASKIERNEEGTGYLIHNYDMYMQRAVPTLLGFNGNLQHTEVCTYILLSSILPLYSFYISIN